MTLPRRFVDLRFWLMTAAALAGVLVTASLGHWQLSRAAQKEAFQAILDERGRMPAIDGKTLLSLGVTNAEGGGSDGQVLLHRRVVLEGRWLPEQTVYLDNRQMYGRPGFFVVTPLLLAGAGNTVVLVQRGWVPRNFQDRTQLPPVATSSDAEVRVEGRVAREPSRLYEFSGASSVQGSSRIRQNLDLAAFRSEIGMPLANLTVLQTGSAGEGLQRDWPVITTGVDKHYGYAFQWFGLCGLVAILYVWFQIFRRFIRPRSQPAV